MAKAINETKSDTLKLLIHQRKYLIMDIAEADTIIKAEMLIEKLINLDIKIKYLSNIDAEVMQAEKEIGEVR